MRIMLLELFKSVFLGLVEGITEFLPISSTGHLILMNRFAHFSNPGFEMFFDIFIQLGAILAVVFLFREKILDSFSSGKKATVFWGKLMLAFLPSAVAGLLFADAIENVLFNSTCVASALVVGGVLMIVIERGCAGRAVVCSAEDVSFKTAFLIGVSQCFALIPGMSRSASTIMGGMLCGLSAGAAAEFSFLLAIPTMFAASGYSMLKYSAGISMFHVVLLAVGFVTAFVSAFFVVEAFMRFLRTHRLFGFAVYRIVVGAGILISAFCCV